MLFTKLSIFSKGISPCVNTYPQLFSLQIHTVQAVYTMAGIRCVPNGQTLITKAGRNNRSFALIFFIGLAVWTIINTAAQIGFLDNGTTADRTGRFISIFG
jgi:hypothetical protein